MIPFAIAALLLIGAGCGKQPAAPVPAAAPAPDAPAKPPGLPRETEERFDEEDNLDQALKELDAVE